MKKLSAILCCGLLMFTSCQKDLSDSGNGNANNTPPDYMPMTAGSTWTYQTSLGASYTLTATSRDTIASGKTYKVFTSTDGQNRYRVKSGNEYYQLTIIPQIAPNGFSELYLKDNQPVSSNWKTSLPVTVPGIPIPLTADLNYAVKSKDTSLTVNNKVYNKVIRVRLDISVAAMGNLGGGDFYYADKVGLIQSNMNVSAQGTQMVNQSEILLSYTIK